MARIVDVVNFNADASCLSVGAWHNALENGRDSVLYRWLNLYVTYKKKVVLGFPGATAADIAIRNPDAINLINEHPDIFEIILRPFSHDIAFLRSKYGFEHNLLLGIQTIRHLFRHIHDYYLPPEFMCTAMQVRQLAQKGITGIFINPERFDSQISSRIPDSPYLVQGILNTSLVCVPCAKHWTAAYLDGIHTFSADNWNALLEKTRGITYTWRDGESAFLLPDTLQREDAWLNNANDTAQRAFLNEVLPANESEPFPAEYSAAENALKTYPIHPFTAWIREMKMFWYISQIQALENTIADLTIEQKSIWLQAINSDILSSVEKRSPVIHIKRDPSALHSNHKFTIYRQEKNLEGEECLYLLKHFNAPDIQDYYHHSTSPHIIKLRDRTSFLYNLEDSNGAL